jgi:hypothetical protein
MAGPGPDLGPFGSGLSGAGQFVHLVSLENPSPGLRVVGVLDPGIHALIR